MVALDAWLAALQLARALRHDPDTPASTPAPPEVLAQEPRSIAGVQGQTAGIEQPGPRLGRYAFTLDATLGLQTYDVSGNEAQFDEDLNVQRGLLLRALEVEGTAIPGAEEGAGGLRSFGFSAFGLGGADAGLRGRADFGALRAHLVHERTSYTGTSESDVHSFDLERSRGSLGLEHESTTGALRRAGLEFTWLAQDRFTLGSRRVNNRFVDDVPVQQTQRTRGVGGDVGLDLEGTTLELSGGFEFLSARDRRAYSKPDPRFPTVLLSEEFAADDSGNARRASARLTRPLAQGLDLELGLDWHASNLDGTQAQEEVGTFNDPDLPFERVTEGDSELDERFLQGDLGVRMDLGGGRTLGFGYRRSHEREQGELEQVVTTDEQMGDPPTVFTHEESVVRRTQIDLLQGEFSTPLGERVDLDLTLELGREEVFVERVFEGATSRSLDDSEPIAGVEGALHLETGARSTLTLAAGHGTRGTEATNVAVIQDFEPTRRHFQELRWHWRGALDASVQASLRLEHRASDAFHSEEHAETASVAAGHHLAGPLRGEAALTLRRVDSEADTNFLIFDQGITVVPGVVGFESSQRIGSLGLDLALSEAFHPRIQVSLAMDEGDVAYDVERAAATLPWRASRTLELGVDLGWTRFDGEELLDASDYSALVAFVYMRVLL